MTDQKKILIVDDEPDLCLLMKSYFTQKSYDVHYTHTLSDGVRLMEQWQPDILFLDNNLPDGTGWARVGLFVQLNPQLRLFLMSGFQPTFPEIPGFTYQVLIKPISFADLENL